ncbi:hypothetical protein GCM10011583_71490 [Streptomyces camponoticapitis]|uniref:Uncharacterized protein n=1 Tax=Streptomyces camponoticapitis TaxID=1616125 RepID=A0ABQ2EXH0_9ACTN|nr:hypothetical protein GCM10011583_71490 [Streptomyces camponoticapitis]
MIHLDTDEGQEDAIFGRGPEHAVVCITLVPAELLTEECRPEDPQFPSTR